MPAISAWHKITVKINCIRCVGKNKMLNPLSFQKLKKGWMKINPGIGEDKISN